MPPHLKILAIINLNNPVSNRSDVELFIGLKKAGLDVEVMTFGESPLIPLLESNNIRVFPEHPVRKFQISFIRYARKILREGGHDILHLFNSKAILNGIMASIGLPVKVITYRGAKGPYWHDPTSYLTHFNPRVNGIICLSGYVRHSIKQQGILPGYKLRVIYKYISPDWFKNIRPVNYDLLFGNKKGFYVICIANLRPVKGVKYFIQAASKLSGFKNIHFVIIGKGTDEPAFKKKLVELPGHENIHPLGYQKNILDYLAGADVFVLPSLSEGLSRSLTEAMSLGLPIISTRCGGPEEILKDGHSAIMVKPADPDAISEAVTTLFNDGKLRESLGNNALKFVKEEFNMEISIRRTIEFYTEVLEDKRL